MEGWCVTARVRRKVMYRTICRDRCRCYYKGWDRGSCTQLRGPAGCGIRIYIARGTIPLIQIICYSSCPQRPIIAAACEGRGVGKVTKDGRLK